MRSAIRGLTSRPRWRARWCPGSSRFSPPRSGSSRRRSEGTNRPSPVSGPRRCTRRSRGSGWTPAAAVDAFCPRGSSRSPDGGSSSGRWRRWRRRTPPWLTRRRNFSSPSCSRARRNPHPRRKPRRSRASFRVYYPTGNGFWPHATRWPPRTWRGTCVRLRRRCARGTQTPPPARRLGTQTPQPLLLPSSSR